MKKIEIEEIKKIQLDILMSVHTFCMNKGIEYLLTGGTAIGAIRHGGYIPWDDDIDIAMTRPNYEKFLESFNNKDNYLRVFAPELSLNYYAPYANVCDMRTVVKENQVGHNGQQIGIKIDIFPIDGVINERDYFKRKRICDACNRIMGVKRLIIRDYSCLQRIRYLVLKSIFCLIPYSILQSIIHKQATKYAFDNCDFAAALTFPNKKPMLYKTQWFNNYIDICFEGETLRIIKNYDLYLRVIYGDYLQMPPVDQQVASHGFDAYWID